MCRIFGVGVDKQPKSDWEVMSTLLSADARLNKDGAAKPHRRAGLVYKPNGVPYLDNIERELRPVLYEGIGATKTSFNIQEDQHGTRWVVLEDRNFDDLVSSVFTVGNAIVSNGAGKDLLAAVFRYHYKVNTREKPGAADANVYWIYTYRRKAFYPFVPSGPQERDRPAELHLAKAMKKIGLGVDDSLEDWYGLWGIPF